MIVFGFQFEIRDRQKRQEEEYRREHPDAPMPKKQTMIEKYVTEFLPPPSPEYVKCLENKLRWN